MELIARKEVWLCMQPFTLDDNQYPTQEQQEKHKMIVQNTDNAYRLAKKYQVKLGWGTDLLFNPANTKNQNKDIGKLKNWFNNFEILRMVTYDNARLLSLSGSRNPYPGDLGVIKEGAFADMLLINENVLENIQLLENPDDNILLIIKDGQIYKNKL